MQVSKFEIVECPIKMFVFVSTVLFMRRAAQNVINKWRALSLGGLTSAESESSSILQNRPKYCQEKLKDESQQQSQWLLSRLISEKPDILVISVRCEVQSWPSRYCVCCEVQNGPSQRYLLQKGDRCKKQVFNIY